MEERTIDVGEFKLPRHELSDYHLGHHHHYRSLGYLCHHPGRPQGVALWWGSVENRIMGRAQLQGTHC